jgi:hypothetical protein
VTVQHPKRAVRDMWRGGLPGILEMSSPDEQPGYPPRAVSAFGQMSDWLSLRFRDAPLGAIGLLLIVLGVMLFPLVASFGGAAPSSLRRVLSVLSILFLMLLSKSLHRRTGFGNVAKDKRNEFGLEVFERKIFLAKDEKEKVGPLRRNIVKYGWPGYTGHEPLYRYKDGNHWVHARFGE